MGPVSLTRLHAAIVLLVWEVFCDTIHQFMMLEQCYIWSTGVKNILTRKLYLKCYLWLRCKVLQIFAKYVTEVRGRSTVQRCPESPDWPRSSVQRCPESPDWPRSNVEMS
jgi:hypothetical protein